jgi:hypothetical protein
MGWGGVGRRDVLGLSRGLCQKRSGAKSWNECSRPAKRREIECVALAHIYTHKFPYVVRWFGCCLQWQPLSMSLETLLLLTRLLGSPATILYSRIGGVWSVEY